MMQVLETLNTTFRAGFVLEDYSDFWKALTPSEA